MYNIIQLYFYLRFEEELATAFVDCKGCRLLIYALPNSLGGFHWNLVLCCTGATSRNYRCCCTKNPMATQDSIERRRSIQQFLSSSCDDPIY